MKREIKFSYLLQHGDTGLICEKILTLDQIEDEKLLEILKGLPRHLVIATRQFTGLKDKNGKEIYAGDVVKFYFSANDEIDELLKKVTGDYSDTEMIDTVEFKDGAFYFVNTDTKQGAFAFRYNEICEVIGNIYENTELLKP
jgi:hypothetical protein